MQNLFCFVLMKKGAQLPTPLAWAITSLQTDSPQASVLVCLQSIL